MSRRAFVCAAAGGAAGLAIPGRPARAETQDGIATYPIAVPIYQSQFVAATQGFFKEAGLNCKLVQGGSGVKAREILAAGQADICIGDITHPMQLSNHGREARVVLPVDIRNDAVVSTIRKDLHDQGIDTLEKLAAWKRPNGARPIIGVSSLGGTTHVWATYYTELMNLDKAFTWVGVGNVDTMLGAIKTRQVDVLIAAPSLSHDAEAQGWGTPFFDGSSEANWNKYIGGNVPATAHFTLKAAIDKDPPKMQAYVTALYRATQWIKTHAPAEIYASIEPYVGSTSRDSNISEIDAMKAVTDFNGIVDEASYARGAKVWFREMTGIQPIAMDQIIDSRFVIAAKKA